MLTSTKEILDVAPWFKLIAFLCAWLVEKYILTDPSLCLPCILQISGFPQYSFSWLLYVIMPKLSHQNNLNRFPSQSETPPTFNASAGDDNTDCCNIQVRSSVGIELNPHFRAQARAGNGNTSCANITASHGRTTFIPHDAPVDPEWLWEEGRREAGRNYLRPGHTTLFPGAASPP